MNDQVAETNASQWTGSQLEGFSTLAGRLRQLAQPYLDHLMRQPTAEDEVFHYPPGAALLKLAHAIADHALRAALADKYAGEELAAWRPDLLSPQAWSFTYNLALSDLADDAMTRIIAIRRTTRPIRPRQPPSQPLPG